MGYYVTIRDCNIRICASYFKDACQHLLDTGFLTDYKNMSGCRWENGKVVDSYYSWVNMQELKECLEKGDLPGVFMCFGFGLELASNGDIEYLQYDQKTGNQDHLLGQLAEFFDIDNYIEWEGEDKEIWRNCFSDCKMYYQNPVTVWSNHEIYSKENNNG